jgi:putative hemin transport protein
MALTRNRVAVHEKVGVYGAPEGDATVAGIYGDAIDLRVFLRRWRFAFALSEPGVDGGSPKRSLQFFDARGDAVHKVHLRDESDHAAFERLLADLGDGAWEDNLPLEPAPADQRPEEPVDVVGLRQAWTELTNLHDFHLLLRRFRIERLEALRRVGHDYAFEVEPTAHRHLGEMAAASGLPIMVFVNNPGCVQIHTGPIKELKVMGPWWNILDPGFNLHLKEDEIGAAWVVTKPTDLGAVTSLELFDRDDELALTFFGRRGKGEMENPAWRDLVTGLSPKEVQA